MSRSLASILLEIQMCVSNAPKVYGLFSMISIAIECHLLIVAERCRVVRIARHDALSQLHIEAEPVARVVEALVEAHACLWPGVQVRVNVLNAVVDLERVQV